MFLLYAQWEHFDHMACFEEHCDYMSKTKQHLKQISNDCQLLWVVTYEAHVEVTIQMPQKCSHQSQIKHMLWVHFKCVSTLQALVKGTCHLPANNRLGTF